MGSAQVPRRAQWRGVTSNPLASAVVDGPLLLQVALMDGPDLPVVAPDSVRDAQATLDAVANGWVALYVIPALSRVLYRIGCVGGFTFATVWTVVWLVSAGSAKVQVFGLLVGGGLTLGSLSATRVLWTVPSSLRTDGRCLRWTTGHATQEVSTAQVRFVERGPLRGWARICLDSGTRINVPVQAGWPQFALALSLSPDRYGRSIMRPTIFANGFSNSGFDDLAWLPNWHAPDDAPRYSYELARKLVDPSRDPWAPPEK
jgi:hypothetical protein